MADPSIQVRGTADFSQLNRALGQADSRVGKSTSRWSKLGSVVAKSGAAVAAGGALAAKGLYDAGQAAGDLGETVSKTNAVFGSRGSAALVKWAENADKRLGQSQQTALDAAATFGTFGKAAGLAGADLTQFAMNNAQLATDLASFSNTSPEQAIEAIGAAFRGEAEPMRGYGVLLDDTTLRQTALRLGLVKTTKEALTPQQKVLAAQAAILKQTKDAQGDFARTSGGLAGQQKILSAELENVKVKIGQRVLPIMTDLTSYVASKAIPAAENLWKAYERNGLDGVIRKFDKLTGIDLAPYLDDVQRAGTNARRIFDELAPAIDDAVRSLPPFVSPLQLTADVLGIVANVLEAVPDGVKSFGIQAGIAALVMPRLTGAVTSVTTTVGTNIARFRQWRAEMTYTQTQAGATATAVGKIGGAAKAAAGIGGMLALSAGAQEADRSTGTLLTTLGGAATGFAVGGPWGALIGGGAGLAMGLFADRTDEAKDAMKKAAPAAADYASTLDQLTGATTRQTRAAVFKQLVDSKVLDQARVLGISSRDLVGAVLGQEGALNRVNAATQTATAYVVTYSNAQGLTRIESVKTQAQVDALTRSVEASGGAVADVAKTQKDSAAKSIVKKFLGEQTEAWREQTKATRAEILASQDLSVLRGKIPPKIVTKLEQTGVQPTVRGIARVVAQYKLVDKKQIKALIAVTGVDYSVKQVKKVSGEILAAGKAKPDFTVAKNTVRADMADLAHRARIGTRELARNLREGTKNAKPDIALFLRSLNGGVTQGKNAASTGSAGIGSNMKTGFGSGFAGADGLWSGQVRGAVRSAINAGRAEAGIKSPSRETGYIGDMMGKGLVDRLDAYRGKAKNAGRSLIASLLAGMGSGSDEISSTLDALTKFIEKRIEMKDSKKEKARESSVLKDLRDQYDALRKIGKAQDLLVSGNFLGSLKKGSRLYKQMTELGVKNLTEARDKLRSLKQEAAAYAANIKASFVSYGSVLGLGANEDGSVSTSQLLDQLKNRLQTAKRFAALIKSFRDNSGPKLNATTLQQLLDAGPEAAIATAEAIAAGGSSAVTQINQLTSEIASAGGSLGSTMATEFKQAGINMAAALVAQLEKEKRRLDRVADRLGDRLVDRVQHLLGLKGGGGGQNGKTVVTPTARLALSDTYASSGKQVVELRLTGEQQSAVARGRAVRAEFEVVNGYGARQLATGGRK